MLNNFGDSVTDYIVEIGKCNDLHPHISIEVTAKCDYMAVEIVERTHPGYIAFYVYKKGE